MHHLMVDIETFGNHPTACIQQVGWALFDPGIKDGCYPVLDSGNIFVSVDDCLRLGLTVNESCLQWWLGQSEEARQVACTNGQPLVSCLERFNEVCGFAGRFWCSAPSFDYAILENAAHKAGIRLSWNRREMLCLRTVRRLTPRIDTRNAPMPMAAGNIGTQHVAEYDACKQAIETCIRLRAL